MHDHAPPLCLDITLLDLEKAGFSPILIGINIEMTFFHGSLHFYKMNQMES